MKCLIKIALVVVLFAVGSSAMAQSPKFGYINTQELITLMPEMDSVELKLNAYSIELQKTSQGISDEFARKNADFQSKVAANTLTPAMQELATNELKDLQDRYQKFQQSANQELQEQQAILLRPVIEKVREAVKRVGKANGFTIIFDNMNGPFDQQNIVYSDSSVIDLLPMVKADLKIVDKPQQKAAAPAPKK